MSTTTTARGIGSHQSASALTDEWLTPPFIVRALGQFDLDPCSPIRRPWATAARHYTVEDDGLLQPWEGRVWLNPPYGREAAHWLRLMALHNHGTALVFARTETEMFFESVWPFACALLFLKGRLHFHYVNGGRAPANSGAPSVLIAYGWGDAEALLHCDLPGARVDRRDAFVWLKRPDVDAPVTRRPDDEGRA